MEWNRTDLALLSLRDCTTCQGVGVRREKRGQSIPCGCVLRAIFRACYARFRQCACRGKYRSQVSFERTSCGRTNRGMWSRKEEEYMADFELISRRALDEWHHRVFRFHYLLGADSSLCCRRMKLTRGKFFHAIYRIEEQLGRAFCETEPYGLYPPRDYFAVRLPGPIEPCSLTMPAAKGAKGTVQRFRRRRSHNAAPTSPAGLVIGAYERSLGAARPPGARPTDMS